MTSLFQLSSDISAAMSNVKMSSDTSYKHQFAKKELTKVDKFSYQDGKFAITNYSPISVSIFAIF